MPKMTIALAGNPNVGKSTVFNGLTGLKQHTGNWIGKTVSNATGYFETERNVYELVDIPGAYSLMAHSAEEEVARNYICFGNPDAIVVVCDATCLERNLNLVFQIMEVSDRVMLCLNLMDEAEKKGIQIKEAYLERKLGIPVVSVTAREEKSLSVLKEKIDEWLIEGEESKKRNRLFIPYYYVVEKLVSIVEPVVKKLCGGACNSRWISLKLLERDEKLLTEIEHDRNISLQDNIDIIHVLDKADEFLQSFDVGKEQWQDLIVSGLIRMAEQISLETVIYKKENYLSTDRKLDRILTGKLTAYPVMLLLLVFVLWLTIWGANYPSQLLTNMLFTMEDKLTLFFSYMDAPKWLHGILIDGAYHVTAWVVGVMLPPMAIFFPLFTLLEDAGYLPRVAYNLDKTFKRCHACGKQALTMIMGFGCNAVGVTGCRIIDSKRERLIAILTNSLVPCNGRFPALITLILLFFVNNAVAVLLLTAIIVFGMLMTFAVSRVLSGTILKGIPSSFTLELPPYRRPQVGKVVVRSIFDRTLFVLGRAVSVAIPAGMLIWVLTNIKVGNITMIQYCTTFFEPFGQMFGMDGVIITAFILGLPANEIVLPLIVMLYMGQGNLTEVTNLSEMKQLLISHGWTSGTALIVMMFSLLHWPCATTLLTIKKETGSSKWMILAFCIPTVLALCVCFLIKLIKLP